MEEVLPYIGAALVVVIAIAINYFKGEYGGKPRDIAEEKKRKAEAERNKPIEEMTPAERAKNLRFAEQMYRRGGLTFAEYDALKAKYTGKKSFAEQYGMDFTMAVSGKLATDKAVEQHKQEAQKSIITNAAIGNAVGGLAGGIAGAVSAANKASVEAEKLLSEQEKATNSYNEALKRSIK